MVFYALYSHRVHQMALPANNATNKKNTFDFWLDERCSVKGDFRLLMKSLLPNSTQQLRSWGGSEMKKKDGRSGADGERWLWNGWNCCWTLIPGRVIYREHVHWIGDKKRGGIERMRGIDWERENVLVFGGDGKKRDLKKRGKVIFKLVRLVRLNCKYKESWLGWSVMM